MLISAGRTIDSSTRVTLIYSNLGQSGDVWQGVFADNNCSADAGGKARWILRTFASDRLGSKILRHGVRKSFAGVLSIL